MQNLRFMKVLAIVVAMAVTGSGMPVTAGAQEMDDGFYSGERAEEIPGVSEASGKMWEGGAEAQDKALDKDGDELPESALEVWEGETETPDKEREEIPELPEKSQEEVREKEKTPDKEGEEASELPEKSENMQDGVPESSEEVTAEMPEEVPEEGFDGEDSSSDMDVFLSETSMQESTLYVYSDEVDGVIGESAVLSVKAESSLGNDRLTYQWKKYYYKNGTYSYSNIEGANSSTYVTEPLPEFDPEDENRARYCCTVSDGNETVTENIMLFITAGMKVRTTLNNDMDIWPGDTVTLQVDASSKKPISYTWSQRESEAGWVTLEGTDPTYQVTYSENMPKSYRCQLDDGYDQMTVSFDFTLHSAQEAKPVKLEYAPNEPHWFIKERSGNVWPTGTWEDCSDEGRVKVTYNNGKSEYMAPTFLNITNTISTDLNGGWIPGKYTRTIRYKGVTLTDDIYIVSFADGGNGKELGNVSYQRENAGSSADSFGFYRIKPSHNGYYKLSLKNISGSGKALLYKKNYPYIVKKFDFSSEANIGGKWEGGTNVEYYLIIQGTNQISYDVSFGEPDQEFPLGETVTVVNNPENLTADSIYTFTPAVSGFYKIEMDGFNYMDLVTQTGEKQGSFNYGSGPYLKKGQKYLIRISAPSGTGSCKLSLMKKDSSYENWKSAGGVFTSNGSPVYWAFDGRTVELDCQGALNNIMVGNLVGDSAKVRKLVIHEGCTAITSFCFSDLQCLEEVSLPASLTAIEESAFLNCVSISEITIPKSVKSVGKYAFGYVYNSSGYEKKSGKMLIKCWYGTAGYNYVVKEGIPYKLIDKVPTPKPTIIPPSPVPTQGAAKPKPTVTPKPEPTQTVTPSPEPSPLKKGTGFNSGKGKYKVTGNKTVAYVGTRDKKTTKISIGNTVKYKGITYKITSVAAKALRNNGKITQIVVGNNVTSIGTSAFEGCKSLKKITVGTKVASIGGNAFKNCKKLSVITLKTTKLKTVKANVFKGIYAKAKIYVPKSKLKTYKKLLKKKGQGTKVKIVKLK